MTTADEIHAELRRLPCNAPDEAVALYRRARAAGVAWRGLATSLLRMQDDPAPIFPRLVAIDHEYPDP